MITYIDWDYDTNIATRWKRNGECNQCGDCCKMLIKIRMVGGDRLNHGGHTTSGESRWSEIEDGDKREYVKFVNENDPDHKPCTELYQNKCSLNGTKPWCCVVWPVSPSDIEPFKDCSYTFEKIGEWNMDDMEINND